jgi:hypothetical protein
MSLVTGEKTNFQFVSGFQFIPDKTFPAATEFTRRVDVIIAKNKNFQSIGDAFAADWERVEEKT